MYIQYIFWKVVALYLHDIPYNNECVFVSDKLWRNFKNLSHTFILFYKKYTNNITKEYELHSTGILILELPSSYLMSI